MEHDKARNLFISNTDDKRVLGREQNTITMNEAGDVLIDAASKLGLVTRDLAELSLRNWANPRSVGEHGRLEEQKNVLEGIVRCFGDGIEHDAIIQQFDDITNGINE